jgi:response regulator RpfG family c-di-GMP phosphodiesterase
MPELQTLLKEVVNLPASYRRQGAPLASLLAQVAKGDDGHGQRVGRLAGLLGHLAKTGLSSSALELAGRLHDAGKLLLPDSLLNHPGMFNDRQMLVMRQHPSLGLGALFHLSADIPTLVHEAVLMHHERYDGDGYPFGLKGKAIPLAARIIGLVDVIDALLSARAYKTGWTSHQVKAFLYEQAGGAFDPDLVRHATTFFEDLLAIRRSVAQPVQGYQSVPGQSPASSRTLSFRNDMP